MTPPDPTPPPGTRLTPHLDALPGWAGNPADLVIPPDVDAAAILRRLIRRPAWFADAACRRPEHGDVDWFAGRGQARATRRAVAICRSCPVRRPCLEHALELPDNTVGVWGATTGADRRTINRTARRTA